jgi:azurin
MLCASAVLGPRTARADQLIKFDPVPKGSGTIVITATDTVMFNVTRIYARPGQRIHVQLRNEGSDLPGRVAHDWILLNSDAIATPYALAAMSDRADGYMPESWSSHVLAFIPLVGPKGVGDVTFTAPQEPGSYPYICSFSNHPMPGMRGELIVR